MVGNGGRGGGGPGSRGDTLHVDCGTCAVRGPACDDCVVSVLLGRPDVVALDATEQAALDALASGGLVPPLRLVPGARRVQALPSPLPWTESG